MRKWELTGLSSPGGTEHKKKKKARRWAKGQRYRPRGQVIPLKRLDKGVIEGEVALGLSAWDSPISFLRSPEQKGGVA